MASNMYACFESYYKHGEVDMTIINSDEEMKDYCIDNLRWYKLDVDVYSCSLEQLIKLTIEQGNKMIDDQAGWGVRYIVKGNNLIQM